MSQRTDELKKLILSKVNELLTEIGNLRRYAEELEATNDALRFEKQCLADRIAELEAQMHEERCDEIARSL